MSRTRLFRHWALMVVLTCLGAQPALADCEAAKESCSSSCTSLATSGFIMGMAGALNQNNSAYQSGQRDMQSAQACYNRCQAQYDSCSSQEQAARQREEAQRRAQQQQFEAQQQRAQAERHAQQRAQAEREALRQRVNRVISPSVPPIAKIKDPGRLLLEAQAHEKNDNPKAVKLIYKLVLQGSEQAQHQKAARTALRRYAVDELVELGTSRPAMYAKIIDAYEPLGVFTEAERNQLASIAPDAKQPEEAARDYLRKNPKGSLREVAQAVAAAAPGWRVKLADEAKLKEEELARAKEQELQAQEAERLTTIRNASEKKNALVRAKGSCLIYTNIVEGARDVRWTGECADDYATGSGTFEILGAEDRVLFRYDGPMVMGRLEGRGTARWIDGRKYDGDFSSSYMTGQGTEHSAIGETYQGEFLYGFRHGKGTYTWKTGKYFIGTWSKGERFNGAMYAQNGDVLGYCNLGKCVAR